MLRYSTRPNIPAKQLHVGGVLKPVVRPPSPERPIQNVVTTVPETECEEQMEIETTPMLIENLETKDFQIVEDKTPAMIENIPTPDEKLESDESQVTGLESIPVKETTEHQVVHLNLRGDLIYAMEGPSSVEHKVIEEESDDFFDLSIDELRKMMQDLQRQCSNLQNAPLVTSEQRQIQKQSRQRQLLERYPTTVLRIQFADGLILQVPLPSVTVLDDVKKEIIPYLEGPVTAEDFFLFTSPPKSVLSSGMSLLELGLSPSSVVYIGSNSNHCCILQRQLREKMSTQLGAMRDATQRLLRIGDNEENVASNSIRSSSITVEDSRTKRPAPPNVTNVPKWFKIKR